MSQIFVAYLIWSWQHIQLAEVWICNRSQWSSHNKLSYWTDYNRSSITITQRIIGSLFILGRIFARSSLSRLIPLDKKCTLLYVLDRKPSFPRTREDRVNRPWNIDSFNREMNAFCWKCSMFISQWISLLHRL